MKYWWDLLGYIGRARYELEWMMSPTSLLTGKPYAAGDFVVPVRRAK